MLLIDRSPLFDRHASKQRQRAVQGFTEYLPSEKLRLILTDRHSSRTRGNSSSDGSRPSGDGPLARHVWVLTRISGKFEGTGEVSVTHDGANFWLDGNSKQSGVTSEATCFPRGSFANVLNRSALRRGCGA